MPLVTRSPRAAALSMMIVSLALFAACSSSGSATPSTTTIAPTTTTTIAPTTTSEPAITEPTTGIVLGASEATDDSKLIVNSFNADNSVAIEKLLGTTGHWIGTNGVTYTAADVASRLDPLTKQIDRTEITGDPRPTPGGFVFPLRDFIGTTTIDYTLTITKDGAGHLQVQETL